MGSGEYWVRWGDENWRQVSKDEYVRAERCAGFHNTMGFPDEPATAGFSSSSTGSGDISGRVGSILDAWCTCRGLIGQDNQHDPVHRIGTTPTCPIDRGDLK